MDWDDLEPKKQPEFVIGGDLSALSVDDLTDRITLLQEEITRIERAIAAKRKSRSKADDVFKP